MICKNCNEKNPDGTEFCMYCGSKIIYPRESNTRSNDSTSNASEQKSDVNNQKTAEKKTVQPSVATGKPAKEPKPEKDKDTKKVAIFAALTAVACCALFGVFIQSKKQPAPENDTHTVAESITEESNSTDNNVPDNEVAVDIPDEKVADNNVSDNSALDNNAPDEKAPDNNVPDEKVPEKSEESNKTEVAQQAIPSGVDIPMGAVAFQGHSYYIFDGNCNTWEEAQKYCKSRGGYLAVIESREEDDFLFSYMVDSGRSEVYFGLSDAKSEGDWRWVDNKKSSYQNWGVNDDGEIEPNKALDDEKYAEYDASLISGRWNDCGFGRDTSAYICEWDYAAQ